MKKIIATAALLSTLAGCSASEAAAAPQEKVSSHIATQVAEKTDMKSFLGKLSMLHKSQLIKTTTTKLNKYVGKTWYVFSGDTPQGWDCSGLVMWFYGQVGVTLHHSAYSEKYAAKPHKFLVSKAKMGDIIGFPGHVGLYIGNGYMIHAPHPGALTQRIKVATWAKMNWTTDVTYTRLITTN